MTDIIINIKADPDEQDDSPQKKEKNNMLGTSSFLRLMAAGYYQVSNIACL